ncbi:hypothetical protein [Pseudonocardia sp. ICBG1034]|uniref:hypothetical protein n=1 Tax=Pseudonocardia sp. ICBG1034 TaxID=2844381 RepID=UPI001CCD9A25|nr:hypothetical protein [Pseudonocardia sp. ICBG1034]
MSTAPCPVAVACWSCRAADGLRALVAASGGFARRAPAGSPARRRACAARPAHGRAARATNHPGYFPVDDDLLDELNAVLFVRDAD